MKYESKESKESPFLCMPKIKDSGTAKMNLKSSNETSGKIGKLEK